MAYQPVPNTCLAEILLTVDGQNCENTLYFEKTAGWDAASLEDLGQALFTWWYTYMTPYTSTRVTIRGVQCTDLENQEGSQALYTPTSPTTGGIDVDPVPNNSAFVISLGTAARGRAARGRNYVLGIPENFVVISRLSASVAASLQGSYNQLKTVATSQGCVWVVVSRQFNKVVRPTGLARPVTTVGYKDLVMDSQRNRLPGRGT